MTDTLTGPSTEGVLEVTLPARTVVGLREQVAATELAEFFRRAIPHVIAEFARIGIVPAGPPTAVYRHELGQKFDVTVGFPAGGLPAAASDLAVADLPAGRAVQVEHIGSYETLPAAYAALGAWFGTHQVRPPDVMWEEYLTGPDTVEESAYRTRVVYPVQ
jgi:effector-binding domain-containing protein